MGGACAPKAPVLAWGEHVPPVPPEPPGDDEDLVRGGGSSFLFEGGRIRCKVGTCSYYDTFEIGWPFLFRGLLIGTCSYFDADAATQSKH
jgi:hypothetical protein